MNFLAHILLSGDNPHTQIGGFIADWVRGTIATLEQRFPLGIVYGIKIHRFVDSFTDSHPIAHQSTQRFKHDFGRYAGIITDVAYDYFLAKNFKEFCSTPLQEFANNFYQTCLDNYDLLPQNVKEIVPHLILSNRLASYQSLEGLSSALKTMEYQTSLPKKTPLAIQIIKDNLSAFENEFWEFWSIIKLQIKNQFF